MIVLDTHVWLWWLDGRDELLSSAARTTIDRTDRVAISAWTCWEIATLARLGRIVLDRPLRRWLTEARVTSGTEVIPVTDEIAAYAGDLPEDFPGDPADRTVYATAISVAAQLITRDEGIRRFDPLRTVW